MTCWTQITEFDPLQFIGIALHEMLSPLHLVWSSMSWTACPLFWTTECLVLYLIEGGVGFTWLFLRWFLLLYWIRERYIALVLCHEPHQMTFRDIRFTLSHYSFVKLPYNVTVHHFKRKWSVIKHYRTRLRIRYHLTLDLRLKLKRNRAKKKSAISSPVAAELDEPNLFDLLTKHHKRRTLESAQHWFERTQLTPGVTREAAQQLFEQLDPLEWYHQLKNLMEPHSLLRTRTEVSVLQSLIMTADLLKEHGLSDILPSEKGYHGFISQDHDQDRMPIVIDTGCSFSLTPNRDDFVGTLNETANGSMKGLTDSVNIEGIGWVEWTVRDIFNKVHIIRTQAYYVPKATIRLFSPQAWMQENQSGQMRSTWDKTVLVFPEGDELEFPYQHHNNLPMMLPDIQGTCHGIGLINLKNEEGLSKAFDILDDNNRNITKSEKEVLLWHNRLAHAGLAWILDLMRSRKNEVGEFADPPVIPSKMTGLDKVDTSGLRCAACQLAKQHRRPAGATISKTRVGKTMAIRKDDLTPGECLSIDQYISGTPGRLLHTRGKEDETKQYNGGFVAYDHATGKIFHQCQVSLRVGETLQSKHQFERQAAEVGVKFKSFRADNHPFEAQDFTQDCEDRGQIITYSGVGAHHQNGVAERALQTVTRWARAMMLHQLLHWPEHFDPALWPFAMDHAVYLWNNMPKARGSLSPNELFCGIKSPHYNPILNARVWGCPVYVLDPKLQDGKKLPKWKPRSRQGMNLGASPDHSETVGRILNLQTGSISPQFHIVYDERFSTVRSAEANTPFPDMEWDELIDLGGLSRTLDDRDVRDGVAPFQDFYDDFIDLTGEPSDDDPDLLPDPTEHGTSQPDSSSVPEGDEVTEGGTSESEGVQPALRRSKRARKPKQMEFGWLYNSHEACTHVTHQQSQPQPNQPSYRTLQYMAGGHPKKKVQASKLDDSFIHGLTWNDTLSTLRSRDSARALLSLYDSYDPVSETVEDWHPMALAAKANDADNPTWEQAMNGPNADGFWKACETEIETLKRKNVWDVVERESWMNVLPSTWAFKVKRLPSGIIRKLKARFCARGDRQIHNVDFFDTFAPVVSWTTVRLLLILSCHLDLKTRQVDYTAAFVHADIDKPKSFDKMTPEEQRRTGVYVEMPKGFGERGKVLKLNKSLYGLKQSPRNFFQHLKLNLEAIGFEQQVDVDPCLFISDTVICLVYVDDTLLYAKNDEDIDLVIKRLQEERDMELEIENEVAGFLGVDIKRNTEDGTVTLTQEGLTKRIIEALGCDDLASVSTPADDILGSDHDGDPPDCTFNYASVIGMCWYLYGHSRPDLGFAVSQAARFSFSPRRSHELALIRIGQYLKGTANKGLILKPSDPEKLKMDVYVDSDFMGLYGKEKRNDPVNVKSRTGYVICINGCPVIWASKLQESIALSTMMAEYYALSTAMREVIPLRELVKVVAKECGLSSKCMATFKTTVWEDNMGAHSLANLDPGQHTPRSKFYDVKVHWFRSHLSESLKVLPIKTEIQLADMFTKALPKETFERLRKLLMGW